MHFYKCHSWLNFKVIYKTSEIYLEVDAYFDFLVRYIDVSKYLLPRLHLYNIPIPAK